MDQGTYENAAPVEQAAAAASALQREASKSSSVTDRFRVDQAHAAQRIANNEIEPSSVDGVAVSRLALR